MDESESRGGGGKRIGGKISRSETYSPMLFYLIQSRLRYERRECMKGSEANGFGTHEVYSPGVKMSEADVSENEVGTRPLSGTTSNRKSL